MLVHCLACKLHAKLFEDLDVHIGEHDRGVGLASCKLRELGQRKPRLRVVRRAGGEGDLYLVCVEPGIFALQIINLQLLDRLDGLRRYDVEFMIKPGKLF